MTSATRNLFVAGLTHDSTDQTLQNAFGPYGPITSAKVMLDIHTGNSRCFGFVLFVEERDAATALAALDGATIDAETGEPVGDELPGDNPDNLLPAKRLEQQQLRPQKQQPSPPRGRPTCRLAVQWAKHDAFNVVTESTRVYCRNIPMTMSEPALREFFERLVGANSVVGVAIRPDSAKSPALFDPAGKVPRSAFQQVGEAGAAASGGGSAPNRLGNVAFVEFRTVNEASRAIELSYMQQLHGPGSYGPLLTKFAETASVRHERVKRKPPVSAPHASPQASPATSPAFPPAVPPALAVARLMDVPAASAPFAHPVSAAVHGGAFPSSQPPRQPVLLAPMNIPTNPLTTTQNTAAWPPPPGQVPAMQQQPVPIVAPPQQQHQHHHPPSYHQHYQHHHHHHQHHLYHHAFHPQHYHVHQQHQSPLAPTTELTATSLPSFPGDYGIVLHQPYPHQHQSLHHHHHQHHHQLWPTYQLHYHHNDQNQQQQQQQQHFYQLPYVTRVATQQQQQASLAASSAGVQRAVGTEGGYYHHGGGATLAGGAERHPHDQSHNFGVFH